MSSCTILPNMTMEASEPCKKKFEGALPFRRVDGWPIIPHIHENIIKDLKRNDRASLQELLAKLVIRMRNPLLLYYNDKSRTGVALFFAE